MYTSLLHLQHLTCCLDYQLVLCSIIPLVLFARYDSIPRLCYLLLIYCLKTSHTLQKTIDSSSGSSLPWFYTVSGIVEHLVEALSSLIGRQEPVFQVLYFL